MANYFKDNLKILREKDFRNDDESIDEEKFDKLMKIADIMKEFNKDKKE